MGEWKTTEIIEITRQIDSSIDPFLEATFQISFDWANKMGLRGQKVKGLRLEKDNLNSSDPLNLRHFMKCDVFVEDSPHQSQEDDE